MNLFGSNNYDKYMIKIENSFREYENFSKDGHRYYKIPHDSSYKVKMINNTNSRVNVVLKIDGKKMGKWRINEYDNITVERPVHNGRKFTFVRESSWEGEMGGIKEGNFDNGLVEVMFIPEVYSHSYINTLSDQIHYSTNSTNSYNGNSTMMNNSLSFASSDFISDAPVTRNAGGTILGSDSSQKFGTATSMEEDMSRKVTKRVRLVVSEQRQPYVSIDSVETQGVYDDPIPPTLNGNYNYDYSVDTYPKKSYQYKFSLFPFNYL